MIERDSHSSQSEEQAVPGATLIAALNQLSISKGLIGKATGAAAFAGIILCLLLPVRYTATTKIMTPQQTQSSAALLMTQLVSSGAGQLAAAATGGLGLKNPNDTYIGLLASRPVADAIIQQFGLVTVYRAKDMTAARKVLQANTRIASEKSGFLAVSVTDKDKQRAAEMANAYTEQLRVLSKTLAVIEASQRRAFYEEQLKHAKETLIAAEMAFQQVQQRRGLIQLDAQAKVMIEDLGALRARVAAKEVELQTLRSYSTDRNPEVEIAQRELSSLRGEVARIEQRGGASGTPELGLGDVPAAGLDYLRTEHEVKYRQGLFDLLVKQYDAARLDETKEAAVIQVVERAIPPDRRSSPQVASIVLWSTALGFMGVCSYIFVRDFLEKRAEFCRSLAQLKLTSA